ncbi:MAG: hypothetical protein ACTSRA_03540 [Promethearchaeota archaeon]
MADNLINREYFCCPERNKKTNMPCSGLLIPYKIQYQQREQRFIAFTKCFKCGERYRFPLYLNKKNEWIFSLKRLYLRCYFCGSELTEIRSRSGKSSIRFNIYCRGCNSKISKSFRVELLRLLDEPESEIIPVPDDERIEGSLDLRSRNAQEEIDDGIRIIIDDNDDDEIKIK